jgi:hypothetical protein
MGRESRYTQPLHNVITEIIIARAIHNVLQALSTRIGK